MGRSHNDSFESRILGLKYLHAPLSTPGDTDAAARFHQNTAHLSISIHIGMYVARNLSLSYKIGTRIRQGVISALDLYQAMLQYRNKGYQKSIKSQLMLQQLP